jgi:PAS domain S-box-containing protein
MFTLFGLDGENTTASFDVWEKVLHPEDRENAKNKINQALKEHIKLNNEYRVVLPDGQIRWVSAMGQGIYDEQDSPVRMIGTCTDITERKKAEEALAASETRYRRLFEAAQDGILILDANTGQIVDVNPFLVKLLGFPKEQFRDKKIWEIGLLKDIVENRSAFEELKSKGYVRYEGLPLETSDGKQIQVEFVSNVYQVNGLKVIQCNIRDITERKKAEEVIKINDARLESLLRITQYRANTVQSWLDNA